MSFNIPTMPLSHEISGVLITTPLDGGPETHQPTVQCCHCGAHWVPVKGSGRRRGWCTRCNKRTCGHAKCDPCVPYERRLENCEAGRPEETPANVQIHVPADVPKG